MKLGNLDRSRSTGTAQSAYISRPAICTRHYCQASPSDVLAEKIAIKIIATEIKEYEEKKVKKICRHGHLPARLNLPAWPSSQSQFPGMPATAGNLAPMPKFPFRAHCNRQFESYSVRVKPSIRTFSVSLLSGLSTSTPYYCYLIYHSIGRLTL